MLTREQARKEPCPHTWKVTWTPLKFWKLCLSSRNCTANDCPKWVDEFGHDGVICSKNKSMNNWDECEILNANEDWEDCNDCPHHYGRCGG